MNIFKLSWAYLWSKPLSSLLSLLLLALSVGIISLIILLNKQIEEQFTSNIKGVDMVIGAKGSPLQLILSSLYHIDAPTGNIPVKEVHKFLKNPLIKSAIPLAYGDSYKGYRIVGTDPELSKHYKLELNGGREWNSNYEVCLGETVANNLELKIGDEFFSAHGLLDDTHVHDNQAFTVVGIYKKSGSVVDQLILGSVNSVWDIHADHGEENHDDHEGHDHSDHEGHDHSDHEGHDHSDHEGHDHVNENKKNQNSAPLKLRDFDKDKDITAVLVKFRSPLGLVQIPRMINEQSSMMAALPSIEVNRLFDLMGIGMQTLRLLAYLIMTISGISVFISLYNSLKEQIYELALMRTMGASRFKIFSLIVLEGLLLSFFATILGLLISRVILWMVSNFVSENYHYNLSAFQLVKEEWVLIALTLCIGFIASLIPAIKAYRTDIAKVLTDG